MTAGILRHMYTFYAHTCTFSMRKHDCPSMPVHKLPCACLNSSFSCDAVNVNGARNSPRVRGTPGCSPRGSGVCHGAGSPRPDSTLGSCWLPLASNCGLYCCSRGKYVVCAVLGSLSMQPVATCVCIAICTRGYFPRKTVACTANECLSTPSLYATNPAMALWGTQLQQT